MVYQTLLQGPAAGRDEEGWWKWEEKCPLWSLVTAPLCPQGSEVLEQVLHTLSKSGSLEELVLDNAGLKT